jgi:hypothetical protein
MTMGTIFCPNKLCGKELSDQFDKCPFCGTILKENTKIERAVTENQESSIIKQNNPQRSGWYTFATIMMVIAGIGLLVLAAVSVIEENGLFFLIGLGEFLMISLFCGIVQLLAGIKLGIDNLQNK